MTLKTASQRFRLIAAVMSVAIAVSLITVGAWPAAGHAQLVSSSPADKATISQAPKRVTLDFSGRLISDTASVTATGPQGERKLSTTGSGSSLQAVWPNQWSKGKFTVNFRVASSDGHVMTGAIDFSIDPQQPEDSSSATAADPSLTVDSDQDTVESSAATNSSSPGSIPAWLWTVVAIVAAGLLLWWLLSQRRGQRDD